MVIEECGEVPQNNASFNFHSKTIDHQEIKQMRESLARGNHVMQLKEKIAEKKTQD